MKRQLKNELLLYPCPVLLVTSRYNGMDNVFTVSWSGIASSHPEYITISIKTTRLSNLYIKESGFFTANIPNENLLNESDLCGNLSGRDNDKFALCNFTKVYRNDKKFVLIDECPISITCSVHSIINLGSHNLVIGKVLEKLIDNNISIENMHLQLNPISYFRPNYYLLDKNILGYYGFSAKENNKRILDNNIKE